MGGSNTAFAVFSQPQLRFDALPHLRLNASMNMGGRIRAERLVKGMTQQQLAALCGRPVTQTTIQSIEDRDSKKSSHAGAIAEALGVNLTWLLTGEGPKAANEPLRGDNFSAISPRIRTIPLISWVQAGPFSLAEDPADLSECPVIQTTVQAGRRLFGLRVENDSMAPEFKPGTIIVVDPDLDARPGDFVIVANGSAEATFKQLVRDGDQYMLRPLNPQYPVRPMPDHGRIVGVVVSMERRLR